MCWNIPRSTWERRIRFYYTGDAPRNSDAHMHSNYNWLVILGSQQLEPTLNLRPWASLGSLLCCVPVRSNGQSSVEPVIDAFPSFLVPSDTGTVDNGRVRHSRLFESCPPRSAQEKGPYLHAAYLATVLATVLATRHCTRHYVH
jgi:hypothetical protein